MKGVLDDPGKLSASQQSGRPNKLSSSGRRRLVREECKGELSTRELNVMLELPISVILVENFRHSCMHGITMTVFLDCSHRLLCYDLAL